MSRSARGTGGQAAPSLRAGAAIIDITPGTPQWLDGYGNRTSPSEGVYLPIQARALYLAAGDGEALLLSAEVLAYSHEQAARIRRAIGAATGVRPGDVILTATHTHCAPRVCDMIMPGEVDPIYRAWFEERLVEVAAAARGNPQPVALSLSRGEGTLGVNRRVLTETGAIMRPNPDGVNEPSITTAWFDSAEGRPIASLTVYACHPTCRGGPLIGGDYPGIMCRDLEERGGVALFALGCAGDIRPHFTNEQGGFRMADVAEVETAGQAIDAEVWRAREQREALEVRRVRVSGEEVELPFSVLPTSEALAATAARDADPLRRAWAERLLAAGAAGLLASTPFEIQVLGLAPAIAWIFMAGEMVIDYARTLARSSGPAIVPAGYANGSVGYVPSRRIHPEGGYEVCGAHYYYGQPAPYAGEVEDLVLSSARRLVAESMRSMGPS